MKAVVVAATVLVVTVVQNIEEIAMLSNAVDGTASETECSCPKATCCRKSCAFFYPYYVKLIITLH
jgi:hypothetical protein